MKMAKKMKRKLSKDAQLVEGLLKNPYGVPSMPSMALVR